MSPHPLLRCAFLLLAAASLPGQAADAPVAVRAAPFTVPPATGPVTHVLVTNLRDVAYRGTVSLKLPEGWKLNRESQPVSLAPRATARVAFAIEKARATEANAYPVRVVAVGEGTEVAREQTIVCASSPYFTPKIDGRTGEWDDAIPITFLSRGRTTVFRTYWSRSAFSLLVEVEEEKLNGHGRKGAFDAVQVALAGRGAATGTKPSEKAARYEFLLVAGGSMWARDRVYALAKPGMALSVAAEERELEPLEIKEAQLRVRRRKGVTCYECAIPFSAMPELRAAEGRDYFLGLLVHDPDGTGVRDWGQAAGLWPWQRNPLAWCRWKGARWGADAPFDSKIECGFCSSRH